MWGDKHVNRRAPVKQSWASTLGKLLRTEVWGSWAGCNSLRQKQRTQLPFSVRFLKVWPSTYLWGPWGENWLSEPSCSLILWRLGPGKTGPHFFQPAATSFSFPTNPKDRTGYGSQTEPPGQLALLSTAQPAGGSSLHRPGLPRALQAPLKFPQDGKQPICISWHQVHTLQNLLPMYLVMHTLPYFPPTPCPPILSSNTYITHNKITVQCLIRVALCIALK